MVCVCVWGGGEGALEHRYVFMAYSDRLDTLSHGEREYELFSDPEQTQSSRIRIRSSAMAT